MSDQIYYDLEGQTQIQLLKQICLRLDRHFPDGESQHNTLVAFEAARELIATIVDKLNEIGLSELAAEVGSLTEGGDE